VDSLGVPTDQFGQPRDGIAMDHRQPRDLANAQSFPEEFENLEDLRVRELCVE